MPCCWCGVYKGVVGAEGGLDSGPVFLEEQQLFFVDSVGKVSSGVEAVLGVLPLLFPPPQQLPLAGAVGAAIDVLSVAGVEPFGPVAECPFAVIGGCIACGNMGNSIGWFPKESIRVMPAPLYGVTPARVVGGPLVMAMGLGCAP